MSFNNIPTDLQNIYMVNVEFILKIFILAGLWFFCYYIITNNKQDKTPYILVAWVRAIKKTLCNVLIYIIPLFSMFALYPQFDLGIIQQLVLIGYIASLIVVFVIATINIMFWGPYFLVKFAGYDPSSERSSKIMNDLSKFGGNIAYSRNKLFNKIIK